MTANTRTTPLAQRTSTVQQSWRERFIRPMLVGALIFGLLALVLGLSTNQGIIQNAIFVVAYLLLMLVTFLHFPYAARMGVFLLVVYALALSELLSTGILGDAGFFFLGLMLFATLMFSARAGYIALAVTLITFLVVGLLVGAGSLRLVHPEAINAPLADWLSTSATLTLFGVSFILGLRQLQTEF